MKKSFFSKLSRPALIALALALSGVSYAHRAQEAAQAPATETLPSAREILDRYAKATNLTAVVEKTKSSHMKGKMSIPAAGIEGPMEVWSAKPDRQLAVINLGPAIGEIKTGYDGKVGWMIQPMMGAKILKGSELLRMKIDSAYDSGLKNSELYESIETVGTESFTGKDCYKVKVVIKPIEGMDAEKTKETRTSYEFYETATGLLVGKKGIEASDIGDTPYTAQLSDYKTFGEQLVPTKTVQKFSGQEMVFTVDSVEFDTVTDGVFELPAEIKTLAGEAAQPAPEKPWAGRSTVGGSRSRGTVCSAVRAGMGASRS